MRLTFAESVAAEGIRAEANEERGWPDARTQGFHRQGIVHVLKLALGVRQSVLEKIIGEIEGGRK
jgi:hypothetical protein